MAKNHNDPNVDNGPHQDVSPETLPEFKAKANHNWGLRDSEIDSIDRSSSSHNQPWPLRKGDAQPNGWEDEMYHTTQTDEVKENQ